MCAYVCVRAQRRLSSFPNPGRGVGARKLAQSSVQVWATHTSLWPQFFTLPLRARSFVGSSRDHQSVTMRDLGKESILAAFAMDVSHQEVARIIDEVRTLALFLAAALHGQGLFG